MPSISCENHANVRKQAGHGHPLLHTFLKCTSLRLKSKIRENIKKSQFFATFSFCQRDYCSPLHLPRYLDFGPPLRSFRAVPESCPSCHLSCSSNAIDLPELHSSLQKWQIWPCMGLPWAPCTTSWQRSLPLLYEDSLPARIWMGKKNKWFKPVETKCLHIKMEKKKGGNRCFYFHKVHAELLTLQTRWWWNWHSYSRTSAWWFQ